MRISFKLNRRHPAIDMTRSESKSTLGSEYNDFLYGSIGEDGNGMPLTVLSALARLDIDAWEEAAQLARLPVENATQKLAALLAVYPEAKAIAQRLIGLLPRRVNADAPMPKLLPGNSAVTHSPVVTVIAYYVIFMLLTVVGQWFIGRFHAPSNTAPAPISNTTASPAPARSGNTVP